jgi:hypothetical protein
MKVHALVNYSTVFGNYIYNLYEFKIKLFSIYVWYFEVVARKRKLVCFDFLSGFFKN